MVFKLKSKQLWQILLPLALGCLIFWLLYRNFDWSVLTETLRGGVNYWLLALSLLFGLGANIVRGIRWELLIRSTGEHVRGVHAVLTTLGNYAVNMAFPRMGEVWRCGAMAQYSGVGFSKLLGTLLIDRATDFVVVGLLVGVLLLFRFDFFENFFRSHPDLTGSATSMLLSPWFYLGLLCLLLLSWLFYKLFHRHRFFQKMMSFVREVLDGLRSVGHLQRKWMFLFYTFLLWLGYFLFFYTTFFAFEFTQDLGIMRGLLAFTMSSIAVAFPVQAGIGAWHFMVITTLVSFGVLKEQASNFAFIVHTVQTLWTTGCGLLAIFLLPLSRRKAPLPSGSTQAA